MKIKHASPVDKLTIKHLEDLALQLLNKQLITTKDFLKIEGFNYKQEKIIDLNPLELHECSIVTQGFTLDEQWEPKIIIFKTKHNKRKVKIIDTLITPEIAIFYVDKDTRKWPYTKGCALLCNKPAFYNDNGIISQINALSDPQKKLYNFY